jgi:hypothetical protein
VFTYKKTDEDTFWISGGYQDLAHGIGISRSSEFVTINEESVLGPDLPNNLW